MTLILGRPRLLGAFGLLTYLLAGLTVTDVQSLQLPVAAPGECPAPLLAAAEAERREAIRGGAGSTGSDVPAGLTILQGNAWMLPTRRLILPYDFSTDRQGRLETLIRTVQSCRPDVVVLQEVFEVEVAELLARALPDYHVATSGERDLTGTVNVSGLVTLPPASGERWSTSTSTHTNTRGKGTSPGTSFPTWWPSSRGGWRSGKCRGYAPS